MRFRTILSYLCVASLAGGLAFAAPPAQIRVEVNQVNLFATVRDKHKSIVTGLTKMTFRSMRMASSRKSPIFRWIRTSP